MLRRLASVRAVRRRALANGLVAVIAAAAVAGGPAPAVAGQPGTPLAVEAGPNQVVTWPAAAFLDSTVTSDTLVTVQWTVVSGPGAVEFEDVTAEDTEAVFAAPGTYVLRLNASDGVVATGDDVTIVVVEARAPLTVSAGPDRTVPITAAVTLGGTVAGDGQPAGLALSVSWTLLGGPGAVTVSDPTVLRPTVQFGAAGVYVLQITATDGAASASDDVTITVTAQNTPPRVSAGPRRTLTLPAASTVLEGTASDDGVPAAAALTVAWGVVSGPGVVTFDNAAAARTGARFGVAGTYVLRLSASDGAATASDEVTIAVAPPPAGSGLLAAYGFDEGTGASIPDRSGHGHTLRREGATWAPDGRLGGAMAFDGVNDRLIGPSITLPPAFTMMAWVVNPTVLPYETLLTVGTGRAVKLVSNEVRFSLPVGDVSFGAAGATGVWHHVAVTSDGASLRAFLDGAPLGAPRPIRLDSYSGPLLVGAWPLGAAVDFLGGALDEVRVYARALSEAEIVRDMATRIGSGGPAADGEPPEVRIESPAPGTPLAGVVTVLMSADDDVGVAGVTLEVDDVAVGAEVTAPPYWLTWDTRTVANGTHRLRAVARDAAGNRATTAPVSVSVENPARPPGP